MRQGRASLEPMGETLGRYKAQNVYSRHVMINSQGFGEAGSMLRVQVKVNARDRSVPRYAKALSQSGQGFCRPAETFGRYERRCTLTSLEPKHPPCLQVK